MHEEMNLSDKGLTEIVLYQAEGHPVPVEVRYMNETFWLTQKEMAALFDTTSSNVSMHLKNIFESGELIEEESVIKFRISEITKKPTNFYNLDAIIAVGYRVNSLKATRFRQWATATLREYIQKGFLLDDERLKAGPDQFGNDYFKELLERIRSIRASERRIWQQITDVFAECSIDYDKDAPETRDFYATVQNKFHYAITGKTAAEIVFDGADSAKDHMGLTTWKNSPEGRILKSDVGVAKNYLSEQQIRQLERNVSGFFDYIEDLVERGTTFTMEEFAASVNEFLEFRRYDILEDKGRVSAAQARQKAEREYEVFNRTQLIESDFDRQVKRLLRSDSSDEAE